MRSSFEPHAHFIERLVMSCDVGGTPLLGSPAFVDGNERTGATAAELVMLLNGVELAADDDEIVEITLGVARGTVGAEALTIWLRQRSRHD